MIETKPISMTPLPMLTPCMSPKHDLPRQRLWSAKPSPAAEIECLSVELLLVTGEQHLTPWEQGKHD